AGSLALEVAEVKQARLANDALREHFDRLEPRRVQREDALDSDVEAHLAHGERRAGAGAVLLNDDAAENLDAELVTLDDFVVDGHGVADAKVRQTCAEALGFDGGNFREGQHEDFPRNLAKTSERARHYASRTPRVKPEAGKAPSSSLTVGSRGANPRGLSQPPC